jgi:predicted DNA-binding protein (MmcQ/YjbR family)
MPAAGGSLFLSFLSVNLLLKFLEMTITDLQQICKKLKGTTEDIKWENHLCFNIGGKMYLVTSPDSVPVTASFKVNDEEFEELSSRPGFKPAAYLAKHKWVYVDDIHRLSKKQWQQYIEQSYRLIGSKLPAKTQRQIGLIK